MGSTNIMSQEVQRRIALRLMLDNVQELLRDVLASGQLQPTPRLLERVRAVLRDIDDFSDERKWT